MPKAVSIAWVGVIDVFSIPTNAPSFNAFVAKFCRVHNVVLALDESILRRLTTFVGLLKTNSQHPNACLRGKLENDDMVSSLKNKKIKNS